MKKYVKICGGGKVKRTTFKKAKKVYMKFANRNQISEIHTYVKDTQFKWVEVSEPLKYFN